MLLVLTLIVTSALVHTTSAADQDVDDCNLRFLSCSANEKNRRPVCGTDNMTYASRCQVLHVQCQGQSVTIQHRGRCKEMQPCSSQVYTERNRMFVPTCLKDGTFAPIQCHSDTGYCWCVTSSGKPIPNSSVRNARPNCRRGKSNTRRRSSLHGRKQKRDCGRADRSAFNKNLVKIFKTEYIRMSTGGTADDTQSIDQLVLDWKFSVMDKDKDDVLIKTEYRDLRRLVKKVVKPKRCAKTFTKLCDLDHDLRISHNEWTACLGLDFNLMTSITNRMRKHEDDSLSESKEETEANDCHSDRKAVLEEQKTNNNELYIPECTPDGRYQTIQCYKSTGYCWCVHEDNGKPIPGTSLKDQIPKCDSIQVPSRPMNGCPESRKQAFLAELMELMKKNMIAATNKTNAESGTIPIKETWQVSPEEHVATWNFLVLDKNKNKVLEKKEWKNFRALVSSKPQLRRCGKRLPRYCDVNHDRKISITEWLNCLNAQRTNTLTVNPTSASRRLGLNPLQKYLKGED